MKICFKCSELTKASIILTYKMDWFQEELPEIIEHFFLQFPMLNKIERIQGADLEVVRIKWQGHDYCLNFECYGQSIWLESPEENSTALLAQLYQAMCDL
ncbi:DUF3630 family protein [Colwelliaceae bacterium 6441]